MTTDRLSRMHRDFRDAEIAARLASRDDVTHEYGHVLATEANSAIKQKYREIADICDRLALDAQERIDDINSQWDGAA